MKKTLLIALVLLLTSGMAIAQQRGGPGSGQGGNGNPGNFQDRNSVNHVERLTERLGLDEAQAAAITVILEDAELVRNEQRETARAIALENRENTHAQIMAVLSPEQQALHEEQRLQREEMRQALKDIRAERGFGGGRGAGGCDN